MLVANRVRGRRERQGIGTRGTPGTTEWSADTLSIDFATYNPLSLVVKDQGILEEDPRR